MGTAKRGFRLQEFAAHSTNVNCAYFGRKYSGVLVTGGEDRKINMWAVGKPHALLSLSGHQSAVESVMFDKSEESVLAGAAGGTVKMWDLEQARVVRTFTGHRANCLCLDYHPFGQFFGSGSLDTNFKVWDVRQKVCVHTYKGHNRGVTQVKFSPDGKWVVSGDQEGLLRIWDLTAGKLLHEFKDHTNAITKVRFHPNEYFLASSSADRTVKFWDLDTFSNVETAGPEATSVRAIEFTPNGEAMFSATQDCLKVWTWEPVIMHDYVDMQWSKLRDMCLRDDKLMGVTLNQSFVGIWVVDLARVMPFSKGEVSLEGRPETSVYMKENTAPKNERDFVKQQKNEAVVVSQDLIDSLKTARIGGGGAEQGEPGQQQVSQSSVGTAMGDSLFDVGMLSRAGGTTAGREEAEAGAGEEAAATSSSSPNTSSGPVGLDFEAFAPTSDPLPREEEVEQYRSDKQVAFELLQKHDIMKDILSARLSKVKAVADIWGRGDVKKAVSYLLALKDKSVLVDAIGPILRNKAVLKLDVICALIPAVCELVRDDSSSKHDKWTALSLEALLEMCSMFGELIAGVCSAAARPSSGIDLHFEEKLEYCQRARKELVGLRPGLDALKRSGNPEIRARSRELDDRLGEVLL
ncbi:subunit B1 of katanin p80 [Chloropicon primus]|nr:subunit B1 of katanin p80 [Chloropicon primus]